MTLHCSSANYRQIAGSCSLYTTKWKLEGFKGQQLTSPDDLAIWKLSSDDIIELAKAKPNACALNSPFMVGVIWAVYMLEQFFMMIVLLNFLVAIISQVYEEDMVMETQNTYSQRCEMNLEVDEVLRLSGFR